MRPWGEPIRSGEVGKLWAEEYPPAEIDGLDRMSYRVMMHPERLRACLAFSPGLAVPLTLKEVEQLIADLGEAKTRLEAAWSVVGMDPRAENL